jgi:hypothetical protein
VGGALLVADEDVVDGELAQRVVRPRGQDGSAGIAEDGGDALADPEGGPEDFGSGEGGASTPLRSGRDDGIVEGVSGALVEERAAVMW